MALDRADENSCSAIVLNVSKTKKGDRWKVELQVIGGGPEVCYPTLEEAQALNIKVGATIDDCRVRYLPAGETFEERENGGKVYRERVQLYRFKFDLPRVVEAAPRQRATPPAA